MAARHSTDLDQSDSISFWRTEKGGTKRQYTVLVASCLGRIMGLGKMDIVAQLLGFDWVTMQRYLGI